MRQAILTLVTLLVMAQAVLAAVLEDGDYRIYYGSHRAPRNNRYFTGEFGGNNSTAQIWRLRNNKKDQVTIESVGSPGNYMGINTGPRPGAYLGVLQTPVRYVLTKKTGGGPPRYEIAYYKKVKGKTLIVGVNNVDQEEPYYVEYIVQGTEGRISSFKFARVDV
ncbi:hypothetical protein BGX34_003898 [Mortierella sp. NVP85]|nr:hypothetical protein BGX34_003898 [Mortierella sp. NVP85]